MLLEKKLQLDKETSKALDPSVGQGEIAEMEKEIHRMSIRFESLRREQERLIVEMERAVDKREVIATKYRGKSQARQSDATLSKANLQRKVARLKADNKTLLQETQR